MSDKILELENAKLRKAGKRLATIIRGIAENWDGGCLFCGYTPHTDTCSLSNALSTWQDLNAERIEDDVTARACEFVECKNALAQAYREGHKATGDICNQLRAEMSKAEDELDRAVEAFKNAN